MPTQGPIGTPCPELRILSAVLQGVGSRRGGEGQRDGGTQQEIGNLTQTRRSLCCLETETWTMSEKHPRTAAVSHVLWAVCRWGREGRGGRSRRVFEGLEPELLLSGTICFSKAYFKRFDKSIC